MRLTRPSQLPFFLPFVNHPHAQDLARMAAILDSMPELLSLVLADLLSPGACSSLGRPGLSAQQALRMLILHLQCDFSPDDLEFHLLDSCTYRSFCCIGAFEKPPKSKTIQDNLSRIRSQTLQAINAAIVRFAVRSGVETGLKIRTDCTPVAAPIHSPTDSSLLWDAVRVLHRMLGRLQPLLSFRVKDGHRQAKRLAVAILHAKEELRAGLYQDLLALTQQYADAAFCAAQELESQSLAAANAPEVMQLRVLAERALVLCSQASRRVLDKQQVPAGEKLVSFFQPHTDILHHKDKTTYGHKLCLSFGASSLVLDCEVLGGNPADATLPVRSTARVSKVTGVQVKKASFDGAFASRDNLEALKAMGVEQVMFSKGRGLTPVEMAGSDWLYRGLRRFRAGAEGLISWLKRSLGLRRCRWLGEEGFSAYVWSAIVGANLLVLARHLSG